MKLNGPIKIVNIYAYSLDRKTLILSKMNITKTKNIILESVSRFQKLNFL